VGAERVLDGGQHGRTLVEDGHQDRQTWRQFNETGDPGIPKRCGATWLVIDRDRFDTRPELPVAYRDGRYTLYRISR
jgi:hypothetical protein